MFWENEELCRKTGIGSVPSRLGGGRLKGREQGGDSDEEAGCSVIICISHRSP